jgi:hypothetical protein
MKTIDQPKKPKATKEQQIAWLEMQQDQNERYADKVELGNKIAKLKKDISVATIGFGKAITIMSDELERANKVLSDLRDPLYANTEFKKQFGIDPFTLDFS